MKQQATHGEKRRKTVAPEEDEELEEKQEPWKEVKMFKGHYLGRSIIIGYLERCRDGGRRGMLR